MSYFRPDNTREPSVSAVRPCPVVSFRFGIGLVYDSLYGEAQSPRRLLGTRFLSVRLSPSARERLLRQASLGKGEEM